MRSQRDQVLGQVLGLPFSMALFSFIGVAVTSATPLLFGVTLWDPVEVLTRFRQPVVLVISMLALCLATLATNLAANVVSPANDFAQLSPRFISFRTGGLITGLIGIAIMPLETGRRSHGLHFHLAGRLQCAPRFRRRHSDRGLLRAPPVPAER